MTTQLKAKRSESMARRELAETIRRELSKYPPMWIQEHLRDDHRVTLDHKDERWLMATLLAIQEALDRYKRRWEP